MGYWGSVGTYICVVCMCGKHEEFSMIEVSNSGVLLE